MSPMLTAILVIVIGVLYAEWEYHRFLYRCQRPNIHTFISYLIIAAGLIRLCMLLWRKYHG